MKRLKRTIKESAYEKLPDDLKDYYVENDDGDFDLSVDGGSDDGAAELKRARDREKSARREAERERDELRDEIKDLRGNDTRKNNDFDRLEKEWQKKYDDDIAERDKRIEKLEGTSVKSAKETKAREIANKISTAPGVILPHIEKMIAAEYDSKTDTVKLSVLGDDGKPSDKKFEDLEKSFVDNKDFASIIRGSNASGGGADTRDTRKSGGASPKDDKGRDRTPADVNLASMSPKDFAAHRKAQREAAEAAE